MAIYIIGDLQGCYDPLQRLLDKIRFDPAVDQLWLCGDLVNRGGQSLEVLRLLYTIRTRVTAVLGNHDLMLLAEAGRMAKKRAVSGEIKRILKAPDCKLLLKWLRSQPLLYRHKPSNTLLVHAGLLPHWTVKQARQASEEVSNVLQSKEADKLLSRIYRAHPSLWHPDLGRWRRMRCTVTAMTQMRFCNKKGKMDLASKGPPGSQKKGFKPWYKVPSVRPEKWTVVFGHWAALGLKITPGAICLDSGCAWGGKMTAMRLEDRKIYQVKGKRL